MERSGAHFRPPQREAKTQAARRWGTEVGVNCCSGGGSPEDADGRSGQSLVPLTCEDGVAHDDRPSGGRAPAGRLDAGGRTGEIPTTPSPCWNAVLAAPDSLGLRETLATSQALPPLSKCPFLFYLLEAICPEGRGRFWVLPVSPKTKQNETQLSGNGVGSADCDRPAFCNCLGTSLKFRISNFLLLIRLTDR